MTERAKDEPDIPRIVNLIMKDVGLSAAVLKTVNSPYYGLRNKIGSIGQAVAILGMKNVGGLVMGLALRSTLNVEGIERFWESASRGAQIASMLARKLNMMLVDDAHLFTLFHDAAIPLLTQRIPGYSKTMSDIQVTNWADVTDLEDSRHNTNHAVVGGLLASNWGLPDHIRQAIARHHDMTVFLDENLDPDVVTLIAIGHVAEHVEGALSQSQNDSKWEEFGESCRHHLALWDDELIDLTDSAKDLFRINDF
jgi:HD-like signal output (HDOD) protein